MISKRLGPLLLLALAAFAAVIVFLYRFHRNDMRAIAGFCESYEKFDKAVADYAAKGTDDLEIRAGNALMELKAKAAAFRISSLTKHDGELMAAAREISDISEKEMDVFRALQRAGAEERAALAGSSNELADSRKAAYVRFRSLERE